MTDQEYTDKQKELLKDIPIEFHGTLSYMAYDRGHSCGYDECINILSDMVYELKTPIKQYTERILKK